MALIAQNLLDISNSAIDAHQQAQSTTKLAHEREVQTLYRQLDVSQTETTKAVTHAETLEAELGHLREALHHTQLDLSRFEAHEELRQELAPRIDNLANQISQLTDALNTRTRWWQGPLRRRVAQPNLNQPNLDQPI
jgi:regulator of replication initiation timing